MELNKHLYYLRLSPQNQPEQVENAIKLVLMTEDQSFTLEPYTHFIYTSRPRSEMIKLIGLGLPDLRGFILVELDWESAMSIFTDNQLLINFVLAVKNAPAKKVTQADIDAILDKISRRGEMALSREDLDKLKLFGRTTDPT